MSAREFARALLTHRRSGTVPTAGGTAMAATSVAAVVSATDFKTYHSADGKFMAPPCAVGIRPPSEVDQ
jgi:hypothetical protein